MLVLKGGRDSNDCAVSILLLFGAGTVIFGIIQLWEAYAPQTDEYLHNV